MAYLRENDSINEFAMRYKKPFIALIIPSKKKNERLKKDFPDIRRISLKRAFSDPGETGASQP
jgi:hypothetical protein